MKLIKSRKARVIITVLLMGPFFGEAVSMTTPLFKMILPWILIPLICLYGIGLLIIHEIRVSKNLSTLSVIILGAIYGILEEGLSLRSFFNPDFGIDPLNVYGRVWGINLVWAISVTIYHVVMSIWVPLTILDIFFPEYRDRPIIESKKWKIIVVILYFLSLIMFYLINKYNPPLIPYLLTVLLTVVLFIIALKLPSLKSSTSQPLQTSLIWLYFSGIIGFFLWAFSSYIFPTINVPWLFSFILLALTPLLIVILVRGRNKVWEQKQKLVLSFGIITPMLILFPFLSDFLQQGIVSIIAVIILLKAYKNLNKEKNEPFNISEF
ncbi:hypothetical protein [Candidatus Harpocratesius sp.]